MNDLETAIREAKLAFQKINDPRPPNLVSGGCVVPLYPPQERPMSDQNTAPLTEEDLLLEVVRSVVRHPERVAISTTHGKEVSVLTITVDPQDISHVIGREHRTISAVRHLLAKSAAMNGRKAIVNLDIQESP